MPHFKDLTNQRFNRWLVIRLLRTGSRETHHGSYWLCVCDCGAERGIYASNLTRGFSKSCGCLHSERTSKRFRKHGLINTIEYKVWGSMKNRCTNPSNRSYHNYGGRGITLCERWLNSFENFLADMGPRPSPKYTLDRINNDGNYEPSNCRWATRYEQSRNKRSNHQITFQGETLIISDWAIRLGIPQPALSNRITKGWTIEQALTTPYINKRKSPR